VPGLPQQAVKQDREKSLKGSLPVTKKPGDKYLYRALQNATETIVFSEHDRLALQNQFTVSSQKIKLLQIDGTDEIRSLSWVERENIKIQHTAGEEYFIFAGDIHQRYDLVGLLKAFSRFKKRQQSGMHLIIAGNQTSYTGQLVEKLASFKYRSDVHLIIDPSETTLNALIGAAYAFVYPVLYDHLPLNVLSAIRAGVPVITFVTPVIREFAGDTVIYTASDAEALSEGMQSVYKDEVLRAAVIASAEKHITRKGKTALADACRNLFQDIITK
jgi:glycosyltransferase involved in cell wall biosynthesis